MFVFLFFFWGGGGLTAGSPKPSNPKALDGALKPQIPLDPIEPEGSKLQSPRTPRFLQDSVRALLSTLSLSLYIYIYIYV